MNILLIQFHITNEPVSVNEARSDPFGGAVNLQGIVQSFIDFDGTGLGDLRNAITLDEDINAASARSIVGLVVFREGSQEAVAENNSVGGSHEGDRLLQGSTARVSLAYIYRFPMPLT